MSGGIAYIFDVKQFENGLCMESSLRRIRRNDKLRRLIKNHSMYTTAIGRKNLRRLGKPTKTFHQSNAEGL
jgi:glutamate synthase domain-containing protein 3